MRLGEGARLGIGTAVNECPCHLDGGRLEHEDETGDGPVILTKRLPAVMHGHFGMMGGIVDVGGKRFLQTKSFLCHFRLMRRRDYEKHVFSLPAWLRVRSYRHAIARAAGKAWFKNVVLNEKC